MKKILVGIMYCGENEFEYCVKSIENQDYHKELVKVFYVKNKPNREA